MLGLFVWNRISPTFHTVPDYQLLLDHLLTYLHTGVPSSTFIIHKPSKPAPIMPHDSLGIRDAINTDAETGRTALTGPKTQTDSKIDEDKLRGKCSYEEIKNKMKTKEKRRV